MTRCMLCVYIIQNRQKHFLGLGMLFSWISPFCPLLGDSGGHAKEAPWVTSSERGLPGLLGRGDQENFHVGNRSPVIGSLSRWDSHQMGWETVEMLSGRKKEEMGVPPACVLGFLCCRPGASSVHPAGSVSVLPPSSVPNSCPCYFIFSLVLQACCMVTHQGTKLSVPGSHLHSTCSVHSGSQPPQIRLCPLAY